MDLRGGKSLWCALDPAPPRADALIADAACDVAIIGGGVTGALLAYELTKAGKNVVLLDKRPLAMGSTAASTGLLQYEIDVPLVKLIERRGRDDAERAYRLCVDALPLFGEMVRDLGDTCGWAKRESLFLAKEQKDVAELRAECAARRAVGIVVDYLDAAQLRERFGINRPGALLSRDAAEIDPFRFTQRLLERARKRGLRAFSRTEVARFEHRTGHTVLTTKSGARVTARDVIFATGYETPGFLDAGTTELKSTYALVTPPVKYAPKWDGRTLIWECGEAYFYVRPAPGGRIIAGGEDDDFVDAGRRDAAIAAKSFILQAKLRGMFPELKVSAEHSWAGTFAVTDDGLPYIGKHRKFPGGWFALGYGGNGITFALIAARLIRDAILGRAARDLELFGFDR